MPENNPISNDLLSGLLGALLGGQPAVQDHMQNTGQSLDQVLGSLSESASAAPGTSPTGGGVSTAEPTGGGDSTAGPAGGGAMGDILGSLLGGSPQAGSAPTAGAGGDALSAILGGLLGGAMPQPGLPVGGAVGAGAQGASGDALGALLGGLLGGGAAGASPLGNNTFLAPIVEAIATKIGIPPEIAGTVVTFALGHLLGGQGGGGGLAQTLAVKGSISQKYLRDSGLASQLADQTGLDKKTAVKSLQQVLQALGTQLGEGTREDHQQGLQGWLET